MPLFVLLLICAGGLALCGVAGLHAYRLHKKNAELRHTIDCLHNTIATASHELKTPLTLLAGPVRDLRDGLFGEVPPHVEKAVVRAERQVSRLECVIGQLYDASCLDAGVLSGSVSAVDVAEVAGTVVDDFSGMADAKGIRLRHVPVTDRVAGLADRNGLERVLVNVLSNAVKYTPTGGTITVSVRPSGHEVHADVFDTGPGIPFADQERIFERYYQASTQDGLRRRGMGIGLHLCRGLMKAMGGSITLLTSSQKGSCFRVGVPAVRDADEDSPESMKPEDILFDRLRTELGLPDYLASDGA